jgi:hypothetical protein
VVNEGDVETAEAPKGWMSEGFGGAIDETPR